MPRRKPFSAKQRKAQIQEKRATKRGESPPPTKSTQHSTPRHASRPQRSLAADPTSAKLQSRFVALSPKYLETTRDLAFSTPLARPIPDEYAKFPVDDLMLRDQGRLTCPSRPKFRFGQTKKEVEKNEEGMFKKWLRSTEGIVKEWVEQDVEGSESDGDPWPRSPSWFETNLEVWRQLCVPILTVLTTVGESPNHLRSYSFSWIAVVLLFIALRRCGLTFSRPKRTKKSLLFSQSQTWWTLLLWTDGRSGQRHGGGVLWRLSPSHRMIKPNSRVGILYLAVGRESADCQRAVDIDPTYPSHLCNPCLTPCIDATKDFSLPPTAYEKTRRNWLDGLLPYEHQSTGRA